MFPKSLGLVTSAYKYEVHINVERCVTHSKLASIPDFCVYAGQGWIHPLYQWWQLEAHQGIIGGGMRQIMLFLVQDTSEGVWRTTKSS